MMTTDDVIDDGPDESSWFFAPSDSGRARRPTDVLLTVLGAALMLLTVRNVEQLEWAQSLAAEFVDLIPDWLASSLAILYSIGLVYALLIVGMTVAHWSTKRSLGRDLLLAVGLTIVVVVVVSVLVGDGMPVVFPEFQDAGDASYPVVRVAVVTSMLIVTGPALVLPMRRTGWSIVVTMAVVAMALRYGAFADTVGGFAVGMMCASLVLWIFGSNRALPNRSDVASGLATFGMEADGVAAAESQSWGARDFVAAVNGRPVAIRVYGRDAKEAQLVNRWWRSLWYRDSGPKLTSSRLHLVEHEALLTMTARDAGVTTPEVLAFGEPTPKTALIVLSSHGPSISTASADDVDNASMTEMWREVARLHEAQIAHGRLNTRTVSLDGAAPVLTSFNAASTSAPESRIHADVTELLATSAAALGTERAVRAARAGLGDEALAEALPYVQRSAVGSEARRDIPTSKSFFPTLRTEVAAQLDIEEPEPARLTRINWRSILVFVLTLTAAYALLGMLAGIAWSDVWAELQNARWGWIIFGLLVATSTLVTDAYSLMAAVSVPVPLKPSVHLQSGIKFVQLAVGGAAGRMATNITFLRRFGADPTDAVTQGGVDSFSGFVVQAVILLLPAVFGNVDILPDNAVADIDWLMLLGITLFAIFVSVIVWRRVAVIREKIVPAVRQMWNGLRRLGRDPSRLVQLFGANLASQLLFGLSLWLTALAFGWTLPFLSVVVVYVMMALLSGLMPIPGGVGVSEAVLTTGLVVIGVDQSAAFAIAVTFRVSSAYLPPVWGFFSLRWLQSNEYL